MSIARIAIITGAAGGIGAAVAKRLARDGLNVAINDLPNKQDLLDSVAKEIRALGRKAITVTGDISSEEDVKNMIKQTVDQLGGLDVMVANAGFGYPKLLIESSTEDWDRQTAVNARGTFLCYKHAAIQMIAQGRGGNIVATGSMTGKKGVINMTTYVMSKFAIRGLTQTAALELRPYNINVNAFAPGVIDTPLAATQAVEGGLSYMTLAKRIIGLPDDAPHGNTESMASIASYLSSRESHFITGQTINADGGLNFD